MSVYYIIESTQRKHHWKQHFIFAFFIFNFNSQNAALAWKQGLGPWWLFYIKPRIDILIYFTLAMKYDSRRLNSVSYFHIYINLHALKIKYIVCVLKGVSVLP